jgi:hypothetical protein
MDNDQKEKPSSRLSWPAIAILAVIFVLLAAARLLWAFSLYYEVIPLGILAVIFICIQIWRKKPNGVGP